jgi:putative transposase
MLRAFKYRIYPTPEQETVFRRTVGCSRYVWNRALHLRSEAWKNGQNRIPGKDLHAKLTEWKREEDTKWLADVSSVALQQKINDLDVAYKNFFEKRAKYPKFKKKSSGGSFRLVKTGFRFKDGQLFVAKCKEPVQVRWSRKLPKGSNPTSITIKMTPDQKWYVSILVDDHTVNPLPRSDKQVGLDMGITALVTTSDGEKASNPKAYKQELNKLKKQHRELSRKQKGSNNRFKAKVKLARTHQRISNIRRDQLHKLTTRLVHENQVIAVEDLSVRNMLKNHCLAGSISDSGWRMIRSMLEYKCKWYGRELLIVDRWFPSSKTCSGCGHVVDKLKLDIREWICPKCGTVHCRDTNAAKNILAAGHVVNACGGDVRPKGLRAWRQSPAKQETSRATGRIPRL